MSDCECAAGFEIPLRGMRLDLDKDVIRQIVREIVGGGGGSGEGLPVFSLIWSFSGMESGFLDISQDNGLLARADFPNAWAKLEQMIAAGNVAVIDDETWMGEKDINGGVCGKFSLGDGATTFRVPLITSMEIAAVDAGHVLGDYQPDQMRPITGTSGSSFGRVAIDGWEGALEGGSRTVHRASPNVSGTFCENFKINSARLGIHYSGEDTHSKRIFAVPLLKM